MKWIERHGDPDGDGYIEYQTRNPVTGLQNQCWKDSGNSISTPMAGSRRYRGDM